MMRAWMLLVALSLPPALSAQLPAYNLPDDPAFTFLGVAPRRVANPGTLPKLGLAIADGIDVDGRVNAGLAVGFLPSTIVRFSPTIEQYRNGTPAFWFYNTQLSLATVRSSGDTGSTDLAYGLRTIFRGPEPYTDQDFRDDMASVLDRCLAEAGQVDSSTMVIEERSGVRPVAVRNPDDPTKSMRASEGKPVTQDTLELTYLDTRGKPVRTEKVVVRKIRDGAVVTQDTVRAWKTAANTLNSVVALDCANRGKARTLKRWMDRHWNDASLALSFAAGNRFEQSSRRRTHSRGTGLWMVGGVPIRRKASGPEAAVANIGQLAAQLHYAAAPRSAIREKSSWDWGLRAVAGSARSNAFAELTRGLEAGAKRVERAWSTGVEYMAAESVWLSVGVGDRFSEVSTSSRSFVFMNLKWGVAREPELAAR